MNEKLVAYSLAIMKTGARHVPGLTGQSRNNASMGKVFHSIEFTSYIKIKIFYLLGPVVKIFT